MKKTKVRLEVCENKLNDALFGVLVVTNFVFALSNRLMTEMPVENPKDLNCLLYDADTSILE